ncbi:MAG: Hpt domain-containing protein [Thermodesulfobacteriota bacterium]|nr:Hpt domain-containing protein [Thermodesulfobacteriota bacterium]
MPQLLLTDRVSAFLCEHYKLSDDKVTDMLPTFLSVLQNHFRDLERVLGQKDVRAIGKAGHTLKGALVSLGLDDFAEIALSIETAGKEGRREFDFQGLVAQLKENLAEIL